MDLFGEEEKKVTEGPITGYSLKVIAPKKRSDITKWILLCILLLALIAGIAFGGNLIWKKIKNKREERKIAKRIEEERLKNEQEANIPSIEKIKNNSTENSKKPKKIENFSQKQNEMLNGKNSEIYLIIAGGPVSKTKGVLDMLESENVKANFFFVGNKIKENENVIKDIFSKGHYVSTTGNSEDYIDMYSSSENVYNNIKEAQKELKSVFEGDFDSYLTLLPGPLLVSSFNQIKSETEALLNQNNIDVVKFNQYANFEDQIEDLNVVLDSKMADGSNIALLLYETEAQNLEILNNIISKFKNASYKFKTYYDFSEDMKNASEKQELEEMLKSNEEGTNKENKEIEENEENQNIINSITNLN